MPLPIYTLPSPPPLQLCNSGIPKTMRFSEFSIELPLTKNET